jgi:hypothetical protein
MTKEGFHEYYCFGSWHQGGLGVGDLGRGAGAILHEIGSCVLSIFHITQHHSTLATWTLIIILTIAPIQWAFWALLHGRPWKKSGHGISMNASSRRRSGARVTIWDLLNPIHFHTPNAKNSRIVSSHGIWKEFGIQDFVILGYNWTG